ncbi:serine hydrolase [Caballeronia terrestris]|uniref:serine hydrolase n=1 Tax=Caballeronia terrestris TaxID=1226301 RepID=UPI002E1113C8
MDDSARAQLERIVIAQIDAGRIPGAVVMVGDAHGVSYARAFGMRVVSPRPEPMTLDTVFDLASLTKPVATTTAVMQLVEEGRLQLDAPVARYWPEFAANGKQDVTLRQLLSHTSGLRPDLPSLSAAHTRADVLREVLAEQLQAEPGTRVIYSDLNFVVLGVLVERVTHRSLDTYCRAYIFAPLGMRDTGFLPDRARASRSAATTPDRFGMRRGRVHDPTAARMGGVSGHAGVFSTARDLAQFAQMILNAGRAGELRILQPSSVTALAMPATSAALASASPMRALGWELYAPLASNRGRLPAVGSIGHTGYTGTAIWIDFASRKFLVILTNRVHPDDRGDARPLREQVVALLASREPPLSAHELARLLPWAASAIDAASALPVSKGPVRTGIDVLEDDLFAPLAGLRIGLVTNHSGFDSRGRRTIDVLAQAPGVTLATLFAPEHGLGTDRDERIDDARDPATGLVVHSLYTGGRRFADAALKGLDALVFDIQDAGVRFFTYETTLGYALEAAAHRHIPLFVLDRPDPLGGDTFGGPMLDAGHESFTGYFPLPLMPGLTVGELASLFNRERHIEADLRVIPMRNYRRSMRMADTGLGWVPLSPNLRTPSQLNLYPDVALLEGANVSVGRGTPHPFEWIGAPWIDAMRLVRALNALDLGVQFGPIDFLPTESAYRGMPCHGVAIVAHDRSRPPGRVGVALLATLHALYPQEFDLAATRESVGSQAVWEAVRDGASLEALDVIEADRIERFARLRAPYLRYPDE